MERLLRRLSSKPESWTNDMADPVVLNTRGETTVHPTAIVDGGAELGTGVTVGPWALVGPGVRVGDGTVIGPRVYIEKDTHIGEDCFLANGAVLGTDPQDLKFKGESAMLEIGDRVRVRVDEARQH